MEIKEIIDPNFKSQWNQFVAGNTSPSSFLQSWDWGKFRKEKLDADIKRLAIYENNELIAVAQFIKEPLPLGKFYWSCPRGPVIKIQNAKIKNQNEGIFELLINKIKETAKEEKIVFVRIELPHFCHPRESGDPEKKEWIPDPPQMRSKRVGNDKIKQPQILIHSINPPDTLLLDLTKSEEEILANMHQKTRYNIRLAEKHDVKIRFMNYDLRFKNKDINNFYEILEQTAKRDGIKIFNKSYYENLINCFKDLRFTIYDLRINIFFAEYNNQILSAIMVIGFGNAATYLHGGSSNEYRELMPNYALQWAAIKWAKAQEYKWYDFWGIQPTANNQPPQMRGKQLTIKNNDWAGISRFKKGFVGEKTGKEMNYQGAMDYVINKKWYNLYRLAKIFRT